MHRGLYNGRGQGFHEKVSVLMDTRTGHLKPGPNLARGVWFPRIPLALAETR
jgi:hypothetical protein